MLQTATPLSLRLLGGFAVEGSHGNIALPISAQRVVAYLALQDRPVHRRRLAGVLWPDTTDVRGGQPSLPRCGARGSRHPSSATTKRA